MDITLGLTLKLITWIYIRDNCQDEMPTAAASATANAITIRTFMDLRPIAYATNTVNSHNGLKIRIFGKTNSTGMGSGLLRLKNGSGHLCYLPDTFVTFP